MIYLVGDSRHRNTWHTDYATEINDFGNYVDKETSTYHAKMSSFVCQGFARDRENGYEWLHDLQTYRKEQIQGYATGHPEVLPDLQEYLGWEHRFWSAWY